MKKQYDIRRQLQEVYAHRLSLRIQRKMKKNCRNCKNGIHRQFDLGDFGTMNRWECKNGNVFQTCDTFECANNPQDIEKEMILDISDPSTCGAKEPKIAMLLWVLHDTHNNEEAKKEEKVDAQSKSFFEKLKGFFK